jgi:hypothetical protein
VDTLTRYILRGDTVAAYATAPCRLQRDDEQHLIGIDAVIKKYGIDLWTLAAEFAGKSPDWEMRASLKLVTSEELGG